MFHDQGPLLVIAGAGSGKTKTLVYRVARLVHEGVAPSSILLLTFTRKASQEMLRRAAGLLDQRCQKVAGGTFHSFANVILRQFGQELGYPNNFTILDRSDAEDLIGFIRTEKNMGRTDKRFPKKNTIANVLSKAVNTEKRIERILEEDYPQFLDYADDITELGKAYAEYKKAMFVMDYDDLLVKLLELLKEHPAVRERLTARFEYILVDEYQDTNAIQADIVYHLAGQRRNVMVVGDDSQSIYSFRGANFKNIMNFPAMFPGAHIVTLEENYRSTQRILDLTNAMINRARDKYSKTLFTRKGEGEKPVYIETSDDNSQSRFVCQKILELREEGRSLNDMAVLIRSGWHSNDLEVELHAHQIPFVKHGGFKFVETAHVKDVVAFLRVVFNPADTLSWQRILVLLDGVGPKGALKLVRMMLDQRTRPDFEVFSSLRGKPYYDDLRMIWSMVFQSKAQSVAELVRAVIVFYKPLFHQKYDDYVKRTADLESLEAISERFRDLESFLSDISLEPPESSQVGAFPESAEDERLTLSTIHSAKGLEWDTVFILSAVDGYLPSFQSLGDLMQIEEERRLLYVALTRARRHLFIMKPHLDGGGGQFFRYPGMRFSRISRFLEEGDILKTHAEQWVLVDEDRNKGLRFDEGQSFIGGPSAKPDRRKYYF